MNSLLPKNETPSDVINLILDLVIDIKVKNLDFDGLRMLLKEGHNKKLIRELIYELLSNVKLINLYELNKLDECKLFILYLLELNELGLAKEFLDLLNRNYCAMYKYGERIPLYKFYIDKTMIDKVIIDKVLFERVFKIMNQPLDQMILYRYFYVLFLIESEYETEKLILDLAIKFKKEVFLVLYSNEYNESKRLCYNKYYNEIDDIIGYIDDDEREKIWNDFANWL